jgi:hypothetical protein
MPDATDGARDEPLVSESAVAEPKPGWLFQKREVPAPVAACLLLFLSTALGIALGALPVPERLARLTLSESVEHALFYGVPMGIGFGLASLLRGRVQRAIALVIGIPLSTLVLELVEKGWLFGSWTRGGWSAFVGGAIGLGFGAIVVVLQYAFSGRSRRRTSVGRDNPQ